MSDIDRKIAALPSTFSLPMLEHEIATLSAEIAMERDRRRLDWLCASYQALQWARRPDGFAPPSSIDVIRVSRGGR